MIAAAQGVGGREEVAPICWDSEAQQRPHRAPGPLGGHQAAELSPGPLHLVSLSYLDPSGLHR